MGLTGKQKAAHDFFIAFGKAHGAEVSIDGERIDRPDSEIMLEIMHRDYPSADTSMPPSDFPITLVFPFRSAREPNAPDLSDVSGKIEHIRTELKGLGYDADPNRFSGWNLARGVYARQIGHGQGLKGNALEVTIHEPQEP